MKIRFIIYLVVLLLFSFVGCKENKEESSASATKENKSVNLEDNFTFFLNAQFSEDDRITLFYLINEMQDITADKSVAIDVKGHKDVQRLKFRIKEKELPTRLFIKFNNEYQIIKFEEALFTYEGKEFGFSGNRFFQFFIPNSHIDYNREMATASAKPVDGKFSPRFSSRRVLDDKLDYNLY